MSFKQTLFVTRYKNNMESNPYVSYMGRPSPSIHSRNITVSPSIHPAVPQTAKISIFLHHEHSRRRHELLQAL